MTNLKNKRVAIIIADFYKDIAEMLESGARTHLTENNVAFDVINVPGAFEIPGAIKMLSNKYDGFIALGCVIRGETTHYDYVCIESARGLMELAIKDSIAIGNGILTVEDKQQAINRASPEKLNKGKLASEACLKMMELRG